MRISEYLNEERICLNITRKDKNDAIKQLFEKIANEQDFNKNEKKILDAIFAREELMSTGVGSGIALPHAKTDLCPEFLIAVGISPSGIEYDAIDNEKVKIICLLIGPEKEPNKHIKFLSVISKILSRSSIREELIAAKTREKVFNIFKENETK